MRERKHRKQNLFDRFFLCLNVLALIGLCISYLASYISPEKLWVLGFAAMGYPIMLAVIVFFVIYWLLRRRWILFLNIAFLVIKWDFVQATVQFNSNPVTSDTSGIKILTYNVRLFDRFNWTKNKNTSGKTHAFIFQQQADIICLQEFYLSQNGRFKTLDTLLKDNSIRHAHFEDYAGVSANSKHWGMATLTRFPVIAKGKINFDGTRGNLCIFTDLLVEDDTVRVYNIHLQSIRLGSDGYKALDKLIEGQEMESVSDGKLLLSRMKYGFVRRAEQADLVASHIGSCPYPTIVCGDFNDVPTSYAYQTISKGLKDSFSQMGNGIGNTYVRVPFFRIDNVLFSPEFEAQSHRVHPYVLSDHLAVTVLLHKKK